MGNILSSPILVTLTVEALRSSETSALTRGTWHNIPEDGILHSLCMFSYLCIRCYIQFWLHYSGLNYIWVLCDHIIPSIPLHTSPLSLTHTCTCVCTRARAHTHTHNAQWISLWLPFRNTVANTSLYLPYHVCSKEVCKRGMCWSLGAGKLE
jgi:hypothetical protein